VAVKQGTAPDTPPVTVRGNALLPPEMARFVVVASQFVALKGSTSMITLPPVPTVKLDAAAEHTPLKQD
jgi:hypothetical protein